MSTEDDAPDTTPLAAPKPRIWLVCSYCQTVVRAQNMMGKPLRAKGDAYGRYKATRHGPSGGRCHGGGRAATSVSNTALTDAHKAQIQKLKDGGKW